MADTLDLRRAAMKCGECAQRFGAEAVFCPFDGSKLEPSAWDPSGDPLVGKTVGGRYQVAFVLGEGGMGTVYQVKHAALDRLFAMKVLRRDLARESDLAERFIREARATASVKHPNVVAITDFGHLETADVTVPYFVMELLSGETLAHVIKNGPIPAPLVVRIVRQIAAGLGAAHEAKIVHRDLKPDNVFVSASAPASRARGEVDVRVVDFGAALILGSSRVTKTGVVFGTPQYMSPEQASGQPVDHRADIYALGVIMYEMFTGRVPFIADTYMGVLTQHMFVKPTPPSQVTERARELGALEDVVLRALEKKVEHRYGSMQELAADLDRVASFGPNGELRVEPSSRPPGLAVSTGAAEKGREPSGGDLQGSVVTSTSVRRRRAAARAWVTYGGIALGVTILTLGLTRAFRHSSPAAPTSTVFGVAPPPAAAPAPPPPPTEAPPAAGASASAVPAASTSARPATGRPTRAPSSASVPPHDQLPPSPKKPRPLPGDFADPWAK